jgi:methyl-accepting chemotaxis protein-1 (serine sensor receptor)
MIDRKFLVYFVSRQIQPENKKDFMFNVTIKLRLIVTMLVMAVMLTIGGGMGIYGVSKSNGVTQEIFSNQLPSLSNIGDSRVMLLRSRTIIDRAISHPTSADVAETIKQSEDFLNESDKHWNNYLKLTQNPEEKKLSDNLAAAREQFLKEGLRPIFNLLKAGNSEEADRLNITVVPSLYTTYNNSVVSLSDYQFKIAGEQLRQSQADYTAFFWIDIFGVVSGLIAVFVSAFFLLRSISHPLKQILVHFDEIGRGDLAHQIKTKSTDEMGQLLNGLENMRQSLVQTVTIVRQGSTSIAQSSGEIATGNMDLSGRTEQQAASLEETASSMEELTATVQQNADNARQGNVLAQTASDVARKGGQVVGDVVHTMSSIKESSKKIVDIIAVIDGIAFQTNILALNAAVEAARAGEQGRGFAVVASEVRSLAQRSANAAKEIKELIGDSVDKVEIGTRLVDDAGKTMNEIVTSIKGVADIMAEITAASAEQSDGISQVNIAITKMDEATQQNAALVEQAAAAATSMEEQANNLNMAVSIFKLHASEEANSVTSVMTPVVRPAAAKLVTPRKNSMKSLTSYDTSTTSSSKKPTMKPKEDDWEEF